jgi:hypothetical protein
MDDDMMEGGGYQNALAGLASGMAGGGGDMMPCPMCQGTGMVSPEMLGGMGVPSLPPRLAARGAMPDMGAMAGAGGGMSMPAPRMR